MKLSERIREVIPQHGSIYKRVELAHELADEVAQLEGESCSVCGTQPALLVDAKEKATYWKCADCMFETILDKMKLEAEVERLRETQASILERAERVIEGEQWNLAEFVVKKTKE